MEDKGNERTWHVDRGTQYKGISGMGLDLHIVELNIWVTILPRGADT